MRRIEARKSVTYTLQWDPDGDTWVKILEHRTGDTIRRNRLWDQEVTIEQTPNGELQRLKGDNLVLLPAIDCYLTFGDTNITGVDETGRDVRLFRPNMTEEEFLAMFSLLPDELTREWHQLVLQLNPAWEI